jgi:diguanylate cyclase (GGDEF)-like protein
VFAFAKHDHPRSARRPALPNKYPGRQAFLFTTGMIALLVFLGPQRQLREVLGRSPTSIQQLRELPVGAPAHLEGVVTFVDIPSNRFWLQDGTGGIVIELDSPAVRLRAGQAIAVEGSKAAAQSNFQTQDVRLAHIKVKEITSTVRLPAPLKVSRRDIPLGTSAEMRLQVSAIVHEIAHDNFGRVQLILGDADGEVIAILAASSVDLSGLLNARVRITGVSEPLLDRNVVNVRHVLRANGTHDIEILEPPPDSPPLHSIRTLYRDASAKDGHLVRVRGRVVTMVEPNSIVLEDQWGAIQCQFSAAASLLPGEYVEVAGFPVFDGLRMDLFHASLTRKLTEAAAKELDRMVRPELTTVAAIRSLSEKDARQALPVRVTGVITYNDPEWRQLFVQDSTAGIYVKYSGPGSLLSVGKKLTTIGVTNAGDFAPTIVAPKFRLEGDARLPKPLSVDAVDAASGIRDSQLVVLSGVVHPLKVAETDRHLTFELYSPFGQVHVFTAPPFHGYEQLRKLEDATVRVRGVFGTVFNSRRQLVGYQLSMSSSKDIQVIEPSLADPFATVPTPIGSVLRFSPHGQTGHRIRVQGSVTMVGSDYLYVQDATGGIEVRTDAPSSHIGELVDLVGYASPRGGYTPALTDASVRSAGRDVTVAPKPTTAQAIAQGQYDSLLVSVEGRLLAAVDTPAGKNLVLQSGALTFNAQLDVSDSGFDGSQLKEGSILRLVGVAVADVNPSKLYLLLAQQSLGFTILLRSPSDLTVTRPAPWWTVRHTVAVLGALVLLILATFVWVTVLRRRVRVQETELHRAAETAQAIDDLLAAMDDVSARRDFKARVSVRGSEPFARLVVRFNEMLSELNKREEANVIAEQKLQQQALTDELTGLPNRRLLSDRLSQTLAMAQREAGKVALLYIDLDGFKLVNDSLGHPVGDLLLSQVASRLRSRIRQSDTLARLGGDEFTVLLTKIKHKKDAETVALSLLDAISAPFSIESHEISIGASLGISLFPDDAGDAAELLQQADGAMYGAKRNGKNRLMFFSKELGTSVRERLTLENQLRRAISNGEISIHYQPEFDLGSGRVTRFEALARWTHPSLGVIPPGKFIPVAEECGFIIPLGAYIMERACTEALKWQTSADSPVQVAVNVSSFQFARESFVDEVLDLLRQTGLSPQLLQIELTESATLGGLDRAAQSIKRLRIAGVSVAIDDFGTGYSCLSYLPKLSFDALKIDRSFVNEVTQRPEARAMVHSLITLARNLGMKVIVEGVETKEQLQVVKSLGGHEVQGFLFGRPTPNPESHLDNSNDHSNVPDLFNAMASQS